jgi:hypothetical protein
MQYRVDCDALVSLVVRPALLSVLARSLDPVVRAWPLIEEVMLHDVDPKTVMEKFRKKVQDRAGENARNAAIARRRAERERDRNPGQPGHGSPMNFDIDLSILDGIELPQVPEFLPGMEVPLGKEFLQGIEDAIEEALDDAVDELDAEPETPQSKDQGTQDQNTKGHAGKDVDVKDVGSKDAGASTGTNAGEIDAKDAAGAAGAAGDLPPGADPKRKSRNSDPDRKSVRERRVPRAQGEVPPTPPSPASPPTPPAPTTPPPGPLED